MKFTPMKEFNNFGLNVDLEEEGDQVVIHSPSRPLIVEMSEGEWNIWLPREEERREWPERELHGGPRTKEEYLS